MSIDQSSPLSNLHFQITIQELESIMSLYKERTSDYSDLKYFETKNSLKNLYEKLEHLQ